MTRGGEKISTYKDVDFRSPEELSALLEQVGMTLHAKNRIAGGESNFTWYLAEAIRSISQLATQLENDPQLHQLYGDTYQSGTLAEEAMREHFFNLLKERFSASK